MKPKIVKCKTKEELNKAIKNVIQKSNDKTIFAEYNGKVFVIEESLKSDKKK